MSSYVDLSVIYSVSAERLATLRGPGGTLLTNAANVLSTRPNCAEACFVTGDPRVNQSPPLVILHSLALRWHNYCAENLAKLNPSWSSDRIFDACRKITIGVWQHITFVEWMPLLLGEKNHER